MADARDGVQSRNVSGPEKLPQHKPLRDSSPKNENSVIIYSPVMKFVHMTYKNQLGWMLVDV